MLSTGCPHLRVDSCVFLDTLGTAETMQLVTRQRVSARRFFAPNAPKIAPFFDSGVVVLRAPLSERRFPFVHICPQSFSTGRGRVLSALTNGVTALSTTVHIRYPQQRQRVMENFTIAL
jgi:hypothetical protein